MDYQNKQIIKHKNKVEFQKNISIDRFLFHNKEKSVKIKEQIQMMRDQI